MAAGLSACLLGLSLWAAPAAHAAPCGTGDGVTVVVDTGSQVLTRCAPGDPSSAREALGAAGFAITPVARFPGAICRIDGQPASDPCQAMPPASAYWAIFTAPSGGSWSYAQQGAGSLNPAPGTALGFRFGSGQAPRQSPPAAPAPAPTSPRTSTGGASPSQRVTPPRTSSGDGGGSGAPPGGASAATSASGSTSAGNQPSDGPATQQPDPTAGSGRSSTSAGEGNGGAATSGTSGTSTATSAPSGPTEATDAVADPSAAAGAPSDTGSRTTPIEASGSRTPLLAGGLVIAGMLGAALVLARRRATQHR